MQPEYITRIWKKDPTVWSQDAQSGASIVNRLGWLTSPDDFISKVDEIVDFEKKISYSNVVLLGMGGSSLISYVLANFVPRPKRAFFVLDTTDPTSIKAVQEKIAIEDTLFIVGSKSGNTIEVECLFEYFYSLTPNPDQFIAITDIGTSLVDKAQKFNFRQLFINPSDIGGRFSALSYFALVPLVLLGGDVRSFVNAAQIAMQNCQLPAPNNPGWKLAEKIYNYFLQGKNKLTFISASQVSMLPYWIEQLVAESTGKSGKGILPVLEDDTFQNWDAADRIFIAFNEKNPAIPSLIRRKVMELNDLARETFEWMFATALLGAFLKVNPFDEPDVVKTKKNIESILVKPDEIKTKLLEAISKSNPNGFLKDIQTPEFIALLCFLPNDEKTKIELAQLKKELETKYHVPILIEMGPRYLHSTGQFYKGGINQGRFVILVDDQKELAIPNKNFGFQALKTAQALGDYEGLTQVQRKVILLNSRQARELV
jgi:transaldolase/glucose-6-phosphate isomerase